ncbi:hypothetical protein J6590_020994 [Homalodisca vitripennis]|nr:hypothetical protein J6590_020994 [Homalodisca vitripennis]
MDRNVKTPCIQKCSLQPYLDNFKSPLLKDKHPRHVRLGGETPKYGHVNHFSEVSNAQFVIVKGYKMYNTTFRGLESLLFVKGEGVVFVHAAFGHKLALVLDNYTSLPTAGVTATLWGKRRLWPIVGLTLPASLHADVLFTTRSYHAKKSSLILNLGTNGLKVTSEPPPMVGQAGSLQGQDRSAVTILTAATLDAA